MRGDREIGPKRPGLTRPGQRSLHRVDHVGFLGAVPGYAAYLRSLPAVPETHLHVDVIGRPTVSCVCGALPHLVDPGRTVVCECERIFVDLGHGEVRVVPADEPEKAAA